MHRECLSLVDARQWTSRSIIFVTTSANKQCETSLFPVLVVGLKQRLEVMKEAGREDFVKSELDQFASLTNRCKIATRLKTDLLGSSDQ